MSVDANVYFQARRLPAAAAWNKALESLRWDVRFAPGLDVRRAQGFQRGYFCGRKTGAEMYFSDVTSSQAAALGIGRNDVDRGVQFSFGYELELGFVVAASYALCLVANGTYVDPQAGRVVPATQLRDQALSMIRRAGQLAGREW